MKRPLVVHFHWHLSFGIISRNAPLGTCQRQSREIQTNPHIAKPCAAHPPQSPAPRRVVMRANKSNPDDPLIAKPRAPTHPPQSPAARRVVTRANKSMAARTARAPTNDQLLAPTRTNHYDPNALAPAPLL